MKEKNPGVEQNSQLISIATPWGGWVSAPTGTVSTPHYVGSVEGIEAPLTKQSANQYAESDGISMFKVERFGHIGPGKGFDALTDTAGGGGSALITDLPLNGDTSSTGFNAVTVLKNGRLVQIDLSGQATILKYDPSVHTPTSSTNNDMIIFRDYAGTSVEWVVWSWEYSGGAEVAIVKASDLATNVDDDWYSVEVAATALTNGVPHKLCKGPDGNIYVLDGGYVQQVNVTGALTVATAGNRLPIGAGWIATGICSFKNYVAIIASSKIANASRSQTRVFFWDGLTTTINGVTSTAPQYIFDIPDNFGNGIFFDGKTLSAFTNGRNNSSKIFEYAGGGFVKVFESAFVSPSTNSIQGSVEAFQDGLMVGITKASANGHLARWYQHGFHDEGYLTATDTAGSIATSVGMVKNLFTNILYLGVNYSSTYKIFITNPNTYQTSSGGGPTIDFRTILYTSGILGRRMYPLGFKMTVTRIKLFLSQWGTGAGLTLSLFEGYNTMLVAGANDRLNKTLDTTTYPSGTYEIDLSDLAITDLSSFYMNIRWTHPLTSSGAAIIRRMEIHISPSQ